MRQPLHYMGMSRREVFVPEGDARQDRKVEGSVVPLPEIPLPPRPWLTSSKFADALNVAARIFADKTKKGTNIPYISHLLGTCAIALEHGATEDEAIAALLHDTIEDIKPTDEARVAVGHFGKEVLRIVEACSDSDTHPKPPWQERKERYLDRLAREDHAVLLVSASDKLHNARAIVTDLRHQGSSVWDRFNAPREKQLWYYRELVKIFSENLVENPALVAELDLAVTEMERP
jgi:GTP pyrophosphokinase